MSDANAVWPADRATTDIGDALRALKYSDQQLDGTASYLHFGTRESPVGPVVDHLVVGWSRHDPGVATRVGIVPAVVDGRLCLVVRKFEVPSTEFHAAAEAWLRELDAAGVRRCP